MAERPEGTKTSWAWSTSLDLEETLGTDHTWSGITCAGVAGDDVAFGQLLYLSSTDGRWEKADADAVGTTSPMLGICLTTSASDGGAIVLLLIGFFRDDTYTVTVGAPVYVSCTAGEITATAPVGAGDQIRKVGFGHDDTHTIWFCPDHTVTELV